MGYESKTVQEPTIYRIGPLCKSLKTKGFSECLQSARAMLYNYGIE